MRIREVIKRLNAALEEYGNIPVTVLSPNKYEDAEVKDILANEESVTLYGFL
nr:MAG: hypothetical protein [Bacteriophage sp.]